MRGGRAAIAPAQPCLLEAGEPDFDDIGVRGDVLTRNTIAVRGRAHGFQQADARRLPNVMALGGAEAAGLARRIASNASCASVVLRSARTCTSESATARHGDKRGLTVRRAGRCRGWCSHDCRVRGGNCSVDALSDRMLRGGDRRRCRPRAANEIDDLHADARPHECRRYRA
jgi:hypothetical protein